jgi:protein SCO1/2
MKKIFKTNQRNRTLLKISVWLAMAGVAMCQQHYSARGMILKIDIAHQSILVSCDAIPGYMEAMTMPLLVREHDALAALKPGTLIDFSLVIEKDSAYADSIRVHSYQGLEPDPLSARRLGLLNKLARASTKSLATGDAVPDFTLTGQDARPVTFSDYKGKVVALNFIYTRCALPNFCFRSSNNFGNLQRRFRNQLGKQLVLLTITFDPVHDSPEALAKYARIWKADPRGWHFLTGSAVNIQGVCNRFGVDFFPDEGLMDHSLHTAVIDRHGRLVANLEGNEFTAEQLGDLVNTVLTAQSVNPSRK